MVSLPSFCKENRLLAHLGVGQEQVSDEVEHV